MAVRTLTPRQISGHSGIFAQILPSALLRYPHCPASRLLRHSARFRFTSQSARSGCRPSKSERNARIRMTSHQSHTNETHCWPLHRLANCGGNAHFPFSRIRRLLRMKKTAYLGFGFSGHWLRCITQFFESIWIVPRGSA